RDHHGHELQHHGRRDDGALLQHGSILIEDDQSMIRLFSVGGDRATIPMPATLTDALGRAPRLSEIAELMFESVRELEDSAAESFDESEIVAATLRGVPHFENELWTWRR
ncbi:MAG: hypothetical protein ABR582_08075, partial [Gemmatimonadaceae bacterium]